MKNGVTLIELMVAVALLGVILLTAATLDVAARKFFNASDRVAEMQSEVSPVLLRIKKDVNTAVGNVNNPGLVVDTANSRLAARVDVNGTRQDYTDDIWMTYRLQGNQIEFFQDDDDASPPDWIPPGGATIDVVSNRITLFNVTQPTVPIVQIAITSCYNPAGVVPDTCGTNNNPQITLATSAHAISQSAR